MAVIPGAFVVPSSLPSTLKGACLSSLSSGIGVPIFTPPSHSTSPALLDPPSFLSFQVSPPQDNTRAPPHSIGPPAPVVIVLVVLDVGVLVVSYALCGPSRAEMATDIQSWDVMHSV
ncbi:hypothetical protein ARMSODRAFT_1016188 [Armillaria solidipes]|uniref:Uncharacterized protein n=1 Tax=Armillaria solidipes TaxID=1076256 RepID=A0A2H3BZ12_9AGAR|nr:hypothetical protein ARMSODRAFT_1016188 [Armillaria solidipes]